MQCLHPLLKHSRANLLRHDRQFPWDPALRAQISSHAEQPEEGIMSYEDALDSMRQSGGSAGLLGTIRGVRC